MNITKNHRITAFTLSILILILSTNVLIDIHFCQQNIYDLAINKESKSCCEKSKTSKKSCCSDSQIVFDLDDDFSLDKHQTVFKIFDINFIHQFFNDVEIISFSQKIVQYLNYKPPLLEKDISILFQTFLL